MNIGECLLLLLTILLIAFDGILLTKIEVTRNFKIATIVITVISVIASASAYSVGLSLQISFCIGMFVFGGIWLFPIFLCYRKK